MGWEKERNENPRRVMSIRKYIPTQHCKATILQFKKKKGKKIHSIVRCGIRRELFRFKNNTHHQKVLFYFIPQPGSSQAHVQMSGWQLVPGHQSRSISMLYGAGMTH